MIVRFDCSNELGKACESLVGQNLPSALLWKSQVPRMFPSEDARTDTQVFNYLAKQMQPAIEYQETLDDAEYFTTAEGIQIMYFGKDESGTYQQVADRMRDDFNFGRTADKEIADAFEAEMPSLRLYRNFEESPLTFAGNLSDSNSIQNFIRENSVPLVDEWKEAASRPEGGDAEDLDDEYDEYDDEDEYEDEDNYEEDLDDYDTEEESAQETEEENYG